MEGKFPVGLLFGMLLSIPLWMSTIGWAQLVYSAIGFLARLRIV